MNNPKEKAKELFNKSVIVADNCGSPYPYIHAKDIALLCLDEILSLNLYDDCIVEKEYGGHLHLDEYFQEVKKEIEAIK